MTRTRKEASVVVRVNSNLKNMADTTFRKLGINVSAGISLLLAQIVLRGGIPFDVNLKHPEKKYITDGPSFSLNVKVDEDMKQRCTKIVNSAGLSLTRVVTMYLLQVVDKQAIPFSILSAPLKDQE